jgi:hypothetical protein
MEFDFLRLQFPNDDIGFNPKTEIEARSSSRAVFRALPRRAKARQRDGGVENIGRTENSRRFSSVSRATAGREARPATPDGRCAPQFRFPGSKRMKEFPTAIRRVAKVIVLMLSFMVSETLQLFGRESRP